MKAKKKENVLENSVLRKFQENRTWLLYDKIEYLFQYELFPYNFCFLGPGCRFSLQRLNLAVGYFYKLLKL